MEWLGFGGGGVAEVDDFWEKLRGSNVVPWSSWHEWNIVRESLFSSSPATALNRIRAWSGKGCIPAVVNITASIIEIQQKDPFFNAWKGGDAFLSQEMMSMLYCMAIIRLVNCVIERTRKRNGKSIAEAAEDIRIPRMLIDICHEGSHRDLPSLEILRLASIEALEWLKMYYWNPQKNAVDCEDENKDVQKEIEAKINELAYMLIIRDTPKRTSPIADKKRPKKQLSKAIKNLRRLYLSFPCAVVEVLLNYMMKLYNKSSMSEVYIGAQASPSEKNRVPEFADWDPAVTKLSKKDPNFIFTFLEAVLNKIQEQYSEEDIIEDHSLSPLGTLKDYAQVDGLSVLFAWLVGHLRNMKSSMDKSSVVACKNTSEILTPRYRIMKVLRACLHLATPDNEQLTRSALVLAQMIGNSSMSEKIKKLMKIGSPVNVLFTGNAPEHTLDQQENDLSQAVKEFELIKCSKMKLCPSPAAINADFGSDNKWGVAESWNQCVLGMLPDGFGSLDTSHDLEPVSSDPKVDNLRQLKESFELKSCSCKRKLSDEDAITVDDPDAKKMKDTINCAESDGQDDEMDQYFQDSGGAKDHLLIGGVWRQIGREEIKAIRSSIKIMM